MGEIKVGDKRFWVDRISRGTYAPTLVLNIEVANRTEIDMTYGQTQVVLSETRSGLTDDVLENRLQSFQERYPEAEIEGFGVTEELVAREGIPEGHWADNSHVPRDGPAGSE